MIWWIFRYSSSISPIQLGCGTIFFFLLKNVSREKSVEKVNRWKRFLYWKKVLNCCCKCLTRKSLRVFPYKCRRGLLTNVLGDKFNQTCLTSFKTGVSNRLPTRCVCTTLLIIKQSLDYKNGKDSAVYKAKLLLFLRKFIV